jgi:hypothetical protein
LTFPPLAHIACPAPLWGNYLEYQLSRSNVEEIRSGIDASLLTLSEMWSTMTPEQRDALGAVRKFTEVALRVFQKTNPSKLRDEARTVEISFLMSSSL